MPSASPPRIPPLRPALPPRPLTVSCTERGPAYSLKDFQHRDRTSCGRSWPASQHIPEPSLAVRLSGQTHKEVRFDAGQTERFDTRARSGSSPPISAFGQMLAPAGHADDSWPTERRGSKGDRALRPRSRRLDDRTFLAEALVGFKPAGSSIPGRVEGG